jgi:hypothetical protein
MVDIPNESLASDTMFLNLRQIRGVTGELLLKPYTRASSRQNRVNGDPVTRVDIRSEAWYGRRGHRRQEAR